MHNNYFIQNIQQKNSQFFTASFGMLMPGRGNTPAQGYRFGFNGKENDNEVKGNGNSLDFGSRIYDSRLGRWLSVDPLGTKYPMFSTYSAFANSPIIVVDKDGRENIIIVGYDKDGMWDRFMNRAVREAKKLAKSGEKTTILLYVGTLTKEQYQPMLNKANAAGVKAIAMESADKIVEYINERPLLYDFIGSKIDLVTDFLYIGHSADKSLYVSNHMGTEESLDLQFDYDKDEWNSLATDKSGEKGSTVDKGAFSENSDAVFASCYSNRFAQVFSKFYSKTATGAVGFVNWTRSLFSWSTGNETYEKGKKVSETPPEDENNPPSNNIKLKGR